MCSNDLRLSLHGRSRTTQHDAQRPGRPGRPGRLAPNRQSLACMHFSQSLVRGSDSSWHSGNTTGVANPSIMVPASNHHWAVRTAVTPAVCSPKSMVNGRLCTITLAATASNTVHRHSFKCVAWAWAGVTLEANQEADRHDNVATRYLRSSTGAALVRHSSGSSGRRLKFLVPVGRHDTTLAGQEAYIGP